MKNKLILILIAIVTSVNLYSQDYFLYVSTKNERLKPLSKSVEFSVPTNEVLAQIFKEFEVTSYYQSFPGAKTPELQHFYEIHFKGNVDKFEKILKERKIFDEVYRCDYYKPATCSNPVAINDPFPSIANNNVLKLLEAECAWTITKGSKNMIVAVIDTEFDTTHEDLVNTFAGVVGSRNYAQDHGTKVSSCLAAMVNNNKGIAGIGYNTRVMGYHTDGSVWPAIWQAYQDGMKIINVSWEGIGSYPNLLAIQEMTNNGVVLIVSAGNSPNSIQHSLYADIPGVINVSGVDASNKHGNTWTARNQWVDVCAISKDVTVCMPGNMYGLSTGTSLAVPQVTGIVALIRTIRSDIPPMLVEYIIKSTTDPIADANQYPVGLGTGRVNAYKAVKMALEMTCPSSTMLSGIQPEPPALYKSVTCEEINIDATVPTGTKLELNAKKEVNINAGFEIQAGMYLYTLLVDGKEVDTKKMILTGE